MDLNRVTLIGNLVRDPERKKLPAGQPVVRFALATNYRWEDGDKATRQSVEFHDVMAFGKLADIIGVYVKRGSKVYVEGRLRTRTTTGKDGKSRKSTEVVADNLIMLGHRGRAQTPLTPAPRASRTRTGTVSRDGKTALQAGKLRPVERRGAA